MKCGYCDGKRCAKCGYTGEATKEQMQLLDPPKRRKNAVLKRQLQRALSQADQRYCVIPGRYTGNKCPECK